MKRFVILMMVISCAGFVLAQDIIALNSGERIENILVSGKTDMEIQYIQNEEILSIPRDSVLSIQYSDGRIETVSFDILTDAQFVASIDSMGLGINYVKQQLDRGVNLQTMSWILWTDESYSQKCQTYGINAYVMTRTKVYKEALKIAKEEGLKGKEAKERAEQITNASKLPIKAGNEAVRKCAGEL